jgi:hypothetical protein
MMAGLSSSCRERVGFEGVWWALKPGTFFSGSSNIVRVKTPAEALRLPGRSLPGR